MSIADQVRAQLAARLADARAHDGGRLPSERALAQEYGVSRSTIREALRGLAGEGGVTAVHGSAWSVNTSTDQLARAFSLQLELGQMSEASLVESRLLLEPAIAHLAAARQNAPEIARLSHLHLLTAQAQDDARFLEHDIAFHEQLARCTGNGYLILALTPLMATLGSARPDRVADTDLKASVVAEHQAILGAVIDADAGGARALMERHVLSFAHNNALPLSDDLAGLIAPYQEDPSCPS
ncbi:FadR family transcriptional regulator [Cellulomonas sp. Sa3CUA2]|uniref:FadR family transcriptional regulator n=1 Tax=Cellulomonas avistercoris TaxID=2762242 RepID=A0ABR8QGR5_9CELL|nr:FCD domain-containing protein [Cellulomonas avistercoris]MBD7919623.1 FadR family transcriptional regulator [Cellulomonas avistercoris]